MSFNFKQKLPTPQEIREQYPVPAHVAQIKQEKDAEIRKIFTGESDKFIAIIGPCSADNEEAVCDYVRRLVRVQEKIKDKVLIIPRIYTNKPRTTGDGYKGVLHQPDPSAKPDLLKGIITIRELHMRALRETGFSCADEMLYPETHKYLDDMLAYVAVGARSVENQQHRLTASGLEAPVGMKNPTSGDFSVMLNSITAAQHKHTFIYRGWEAHSQGNPYSHAILRGYMNKHGQTMPNYHYEDLVHLIDAYNKRELANPGIIVDTNHANSGKDPLAQPRIIREVIESGRNNHEIKRMVKGFMVESYIEDGAQPIGGGIYGKSITDPCLGWAKTEAMVLDLADRV